MNATILLRIMPDLRSKYSLMVDGEPLGDMKTLNDAIVARDCLKGRGFTFNEARTLLETYRGGCPFEPIWSERRWNDDSDATEGIEEDLNRR